MPSNDVSTLMNKLIEDGVPVSQLEFAGRPLMMQALNHIVRHYSKASHLLVKVDSWKSFSIDPTALPDSQLPLHRPLSDVLEVRYGYFSSVRVAKGCILVNVNPTAGPFHQPTTLAGKYIYLDELIEIRFRELDITKFQNEPDRLDLEEMIKHMRVRRRDLRTRYDAAGQEIPDARIVFGLANPGDGRTGRRPTFTAIGPLATQADCWSEEEGRTRTVAERYPGNYKYQSPVFPFANTMQISTKDPRSTNLLLMSETANFLITSWTRRIGHHRVRRRRQSLSALSGMNP